MKRLCPLEIKTAGKYVMVEFIVVLVVSLLLHLKTFVRQYSHVCVMVVVFLGSSGDGVQQWLMAVRLQRRCHGVECR